MANVFFVILLFLLLPLDFSFAKSHDDWARKIYSGYLHQDNVKNHASFWRALLGKKPPKHDADVSVRRCSIEFKSPIPFSHQLVAEMPAELTYFIRFNPPVPSFHQLTIKIYTNDDEEYSIDPAAEGKQAGINDEHHLFDPYLVYLILGQDINHLEVINSSGDENDKYVLDKLEIQNHD
jgi:hypothetical protein